MTILALVIFTVIVAGLALLALLIDGKAREAELSLDRIEAAWPRRRSATWEDEG